MKLSDYQREQFKKGLEVGRKFWSSVSEDRAKTERKHSENAVKTQQKISQEKEGEDSYILSKSRVKTERKQSENRVKIQRKHSGYTGTFSGNFIEECRVLEVAPSELQGWTVVELRNRRLGKQ